jgi:hypothetical protein
LPNQWSVVADNPPSTNAIAAAPTISPNITTGNTTSASLPADVIDITDTASQKRPSNDADVALPTLPRKKAKLSQRNDDEVLTGADADAIIDALVGNSHDQQSDSSSQ